MATSYMENKLDQAQELTWKTLHQAGTELQVPFQLRLNDHDIPVICHDVVRLVPKKRVLFFGTWDGQEVAVKLFFERFRAKRDADRDAHGVETLMESNVPTPMLLYKGSKEKGRLQILIFQKITKAASLAQRWEERVSLADIAPLLEAMVIELATQHVLGIVQRDVHLGNFLVTDKCIYTLDGGKIKTFDHILERHPSMEHLALFLAQLGPGMEELQAWLFDRYVASRSWIVPPSDLKLFQKMLKEKIHERWLRYKKKIFRNCTAFKRVNTMKTVVVYDKQYDSALFKKLLKHTDHYMTGPEAVLLKAGNSATVARVTIDGRQLVIKRYNLKDTWHWLRRCLRPSRAAKAWQMAHYLHASGLATAKPVAFIEHRVVGLRGTSYFMMEYIDGEDVGSYVTDHFLWVDQEKIAIKVVQLLKQLTQLSVTHGDLKKTNILVMNQTPYLIDFDGAKEHLTEYSLRHALKMELRRFLKNWEKKPDLHAFFKELLAKAFDPDVL